MTKQEIEKKIHDEVMDLHVEDIINLISENRFKEAESLGKFLGISEKTVRACINDFKETKKLINRSYEKLNKELRH